MTFKERLSGLRSMLKETWNLAFHEKGAERIVKILEIGKAAYTFQNTRMLFTGERRNCPTCGHEEVEP